MIDMRGKSCFSRLFVAVAVLAVAECVTAVPVPLAFPAAAQTRPPGDLFRPTRGHSRSEQFFQNRFGSKDWKEQQKLRRPNGSTRVSHQPKTRSNPQRNKPTLSEKPATHGVETATQNVPLPRPRPPAWPEPHSFVEAAGSDFNTTDVTSAPSDCDRRLAAIAAIELLPRLIGPGDCGGRDMVELDAVVLPNHRNIKVRPTAVLRCAMAESVAAWVRDEASARIDALGTTLRAVETYGSYECRGRNGIPDAKLSEHGKGNAIDVRALVLGSGHRTELTDVTVAKSVREDLRDSACRRFTTVLGPGADGHHDSHIHLDILERTHGHRICQWDVREPPRPAHIASAHVQLASTTLLAQPQSRDNQAVAAGPWTIGRAYKANKFESCTMNRVEGELGITFVRAQDGLLLVLDSPKWKLDRGATYSIRISAGSRSMNAKALAESKSVTIALADTRLNSKLRSVGSLEVQGEGDILRVPLDGSSTAFERLEGCFNKREASETNPFVKRKASEANPFVAPNRKR